MHSFLNSFGYDKLFTVEPEGLSGGLALFYYDSFDVTVLSSSSRMIDVEATIEGKKVYMTFLYGDPVKECREIVWDRLIHISLQRKGNWLMIGDFNEIMGNHEKRGGRRRAESSFLDFRKMINSCGMIDFPYKGNPMSWVGYRASGKVQCRLDRAIGNEDWHQSFSHTNVEYLKLWGSDHRPVLANILSKASEPRHNFRFDKRWLGREGFEDTVKAGWNMQPDTENGDVYRKTHTCRRAIAAWKRTCKTNSAKKIDEIKEQLEHAQTDLSISNDVFLNLKNNLCLAYREEELHWKQKSRVNWLKEGDHNTKFFHATTKQRRARNRITKIKRSDGSWAENEESIKHTATDYFSSLFTSSNPQNFDDALRYVTAKVTPAMNTSLTKPPSNDEIKKAIADMNPDKAPGPDGMTSLFYQQFWEVTARDIICMVRGFFEGNGLDARLNQTNICLIPKTERPRDMTEFRPISLCNVSYKIVSKILCNRLKRCLPKIISETQSAFVAKRLITDNILIAQEAFHALRKNSMCKTKYVAIKTDMSKAYDRVEWSFLKALMLKLGFAETWVSWILSCITLVSYQVLINGEAKGNLLPTRGLRQGDPLSPFLFILLTEALVAQLKGAEEEGKITGMRIARACPTISHLLFADDSLFFCKAEVLQCTELMRVIQCYGLASGQQLNVNKSSIFFGSKVPHDVRHTLKNALGIHKEGGMGSYLGLPENISGSKQKVFVFVRDRLNARINSWSAKFLSKGEKEVLLKSVAQALPTYVMSCFLLPLGIIKKLHSAISNFWWSNKQNSRGIHWIAWDKICLPHEKGGLGFRDLHLFNLALLAKQLWRLIHYPSSLLARILKGRYYRNSPPLAVEKSNAPSYGWNSILAAKDLLKHGLRRTIGTGENTYVWKDPWIPTTPPRPPADSGMMQDPMLRVSTLVDPVTKEWKLDKLSDLFTVNDIHAILSLKPSVSQRQDSYCWVPTKSGLYSVRTGYILAIHNKEQLSKQVMSQPSVDALKSKVWTLKTTEKLKHFIWQALAGITPVCSKLADCHCAVNRNCPRCGAEEETINHMIFECPPLPLNVATGRNCTNSGELPV
ncbi:unnamed protein product [Microthlaspi erraticum]|uniref:Reverse transcriptase domain-containing protein n=1 Tax=Microthlaspi erraticum TaxID=1685480 RepID=A0A6D2IGG7_9BRAS|nr:unnamed protein product [Microthlaspi erraticum]